MIRLRLVLWLLTLPLIALPSATAESVTYVLTPDFDAGVTHVEVNWKTGPRARSALGISPRWGPIDDTTVLLRNLQIDGGAVTQDGSRWIVAHAKNGTIRARYTVDPRQQRFDDWGFTHVPITTKAFFHGMGNAFLLVPQPGNGTPDRFEVVLRWELPAGHDAVCSWGVGRHVGAQILAADLRSSVYLAGKLKLATVTRGLAGGRAATPVGGATAKGRVTVAMLPQFAFNAQEFAERATQIIDAQCRFTAESDFPEFVITAIPVGEALGRGNVRLAGSGLYNSFALFVSPEAKLNDAVEHLFAHELFHFWNGRMLAARDPEKLAYWWIEGLTDYYALRIMHESGVWDADTYAKWINKHLREYALNPEKNATNAEIEAGYWTQRDTVGEAAYQRGLALGLRWHYLARQKGQPAGLDALFFKLLNKARAGGGEFGNADVRQAGKELYGAWFAEDYDRYVEQAQTVEIPPQALRPTLHGYEETTHSFELGFNREASLQAKKIRGLVPSSAADKAGLRDGDLLAAWQLHSDPQRKVELQIERNGRSRTISYYPRGEKMNVLQFKRER